MKVENGLPHVAVHVPWKPALLGTFVPHLSFDGDQAMGLIAVLGTTISPYLFFWQSALKIEEGKRRGALPLCRTPLLAAPQFARIRSDTVIGMGVSNLVAIFIIDATAATLHSAGVTHIQTSAQAAEALRPIAGEFTFVFFAAGIIGTGLLAVPVLAGSGAYALSETFSWHKGLDQRLLAAKSFYATIAVSTLVGVALTFTALDPVKALYWSAVVNGIVAAPVMGAILLLAGNARVMGRPATSINPRIAGWAAAAIMLVASVGFFVL